MTGTIAVRIYLPQNGSCRYLGGALVIVYGSGGATAGGLECNLQTTATNSIVITYVFSRGTCPDTGRSSDGVYDFRGMSCIEALRDVIKFAVGKQPLVKEKLLMI